MRKFLVLLATLALFLGACGSDDDTSTAADDDVETPDSGDTEGDAGEPDEDDTDGDDSDSDGEDDGDDAAADPEDQAALDAALDEVEAEMVALGYTTERSPADDDSDDDDDLEFTSAECQEADEIFNRLDEEFPETASSESLEGSRGEFTSPDSELEQLNVELSSFSSSDHVDEAFDGLASVPLADCMREAFENQDDESFAVEIESVDVTEGDRGDRELLITIAASFSGDGMSIPVELAFTFLGVDRHAVFFGAFTFNTTTSDDAFAVLDAAVEALA